MSSSTDPLLDSHSKSLLVESVIQKVNEALNNPSTCIPSVNNNEATDSNQFNSNKDAQIQELESSIKVYTEKLEKVNSTMESQQKLIHDTIGQQMALKKEFGEKEANLNQQISQLLTNVKEKDATILNLEAQLQEARFQMDRLSSLIKNSNNHTFYTSVSDPLLSTIQQQNSFQQVINNPVSLPNQQSLQQVILNGMEESTTTSPLEHSHSYDTSTTINNNNMRRNSNVNFLEGDSCLLDLSVSSATTTAATNPTTMNETMNGSMNTSGNTSTSNNVENHVNTIHPDVVSAAVEKAVDIILSQKAEEQASEQQQQIILNDLVDFESLSRKKESCPIPEDILRTSTPSLHLMPTPVATPNTSMVINPSPLYQVISENDLQTFESSSSQLSAQLNSLSHATSLSHTTQLNSQMSAQLMLGDTSIFSTPFVNTPSSSSPMELPLNMDSVYSLTPHELYSHPLKKVKTSECREWSFEEDSLLKKYAAAHNQEWSIVANFLNDRSQEECARRFKDLSVRPGKGRWTKEEDELLLKSYNEHIQEHGEISKKNPLLAWSVISECISGRSVHSCQVRYYESLDPNRKRGKWNTEEDELLKKGQEMHGNAWVKIAEMIPRRTQRQCRTRFLILQKESNGSGSVAGSATGSGDKSKTSPDHIDSLDMSGIEDVDSYNYSDFDEEEMSFY